MSSDSIETEFELGPELPILSLFVVDKDLFDANTLLDPNDVVDFRNDDLLEFFKTLPSFIDGIEPTGDF